MIRLTRGKVVSIRDAAGWTIRAHEGRIWITEQSSAEDVLLDPGQSFRFARPGLALVEAVSDASISIG